MKKRTDYMKVATIRGIPLYIHWSLPAGGVLVSIFEQVEPNAWLYYFAAYIALIAIHEFGHTLSAVALRLKVFAIEVSGAGGRCHFERPHRILHSFFVYTAGLFAQAITFLLTIAYVKVFGPPASPVGKALVMTFTYANIALFVINLIPLRDARSARATDGSVLLRLFLHVFRGHPHPHPPFKMTPAEIAPVFSPDTRLLEKPEFWQPGYVHGIEILNDKTTPMEFVVTCLVNHIGLPRQEAIVRMLDIHNTGGMLMPLATEQAARKAADAISADARTAGHAFVCRYAAASQSKATLNKYPS